jgi:hypothetical protein
MEGKVKFGLLVSVLLVFALALPSSAQDEVIQNAVLEGVQLSSEPGDAPHETYVSGYFIFRDKPTSYFYELRRREKQLVFEFNDTEKGVSPIESQSIEPITGFTVEQEKFDINEDVAGLKPEWHDMVRVTFNLKKLPIVTVKDEYSVITFSYPWTTDPSKIDEFTVKEKNRAPIIFSTAGVGLLGAGVLTWYLVRPDEVKPDPPLDITDLPSREREL